MIVVQHTSDDGAVLHLSRDEEGTVTIEHVYVPELNPLRTRWTFTREEWDTILRLV